MAGWPSLRAALDQSFLPKFANHVTQASSQTLTSLRLHVGELGRLF